MKTRFTPFLLAAVVLTPSVGLSAPSDRHPGIYQFNPVSPAVCAGKERERRLTPPRRERLQRLGDLPPAYVIRLSNAGPAAGAPRPFVAPAYDPCAMIERVK
jgi:hypothetical protein